MPTHAVIDTQDVQDALNFQALSLPQPRQNIAYPNIQPDFAGTANYPNPIPVRPTRFHFGDRTIRPQEQGATTSFLGQPRTQEPEHMENDDREYTNFPTQFTSTQSQKDLAKKPKPKKPIKRSQSQPLEQRNLLDDYTQPENTYNIPRGTRTQHGLRNQDTPIYTETEERKQYKTRTQKK
jgi:hypothetical protein